MAEGKQWARLTAERKFRIFLETRGTEAPVGEILRWHGLTLEDLRAIEAAVESAAIAGLKVRSRASSRLGRGARDSSGGTTTSITIAASAT